MALHLSLSCFNRTFLVLKYEFDQLVGVSRDRGFNRTFLVLKLA